MNQKPKVGDKVMGFHYTQFGSDSFFAGTIKEIHDNSKYPDLDSVAIIEPSFPTSPGSFYTNVDLYTMNFDQDICNKALEHQKKAQEFQDRKSFEELCIARLLGRQPITKTYEEYYDIKIIEKEE